MLHRGKGYSTSHYSHTEPDTLSLLSGLNTNYNVDPFNTYWVHDPASSPGLSSQLFSVAHKNLGGEIRPGDKDKHVSTSHQHFNQSPSSCTTMLDNRDAQLAYASTSVLKILLLKRGHFLSSAASSRGAQASGGWPQTHTASLLHTHTQNTYVHSVIQCICLTTSLVPRPLPIFQRLFLRVTLGVAWGRGYSTAAFSWT